MRLLFIIPAAVAATVAPVASAEAATTAYPSIKKIEPLNLAIGETMTITGRGFVPGKKRNTVVFKRNKQRAIFAKADTATSTKLKVVVPEKLRPFLATREGAALPTKFRVRVLARRFGKRYTALDVSPTIAPLARTAEPGAATPGATPSGPPPPPPDCDNDGQIDDVDLDDDNDHMSDSFEQAIATDRCKLDTDADGMSDYWEYESALDLNLRALPYPGKRPYPNALFADADVDYDGDGMLGWQEHVMWVKYGNMGTLLNYSAGTQTSDPGSGLTDDNRDVDADGLPNWHEANGPMRRDWWTDVFQNEKEYGVVYADPDFLDPDSDGDGRLDGADDIDHDGYSNQQELSRAVPMPDKFDASAPWQPRWIQPHNPCLPDPEAITCSLHPPAPLEDSWPPFKDLGHPVPMSHPRPLPAVLAP
ncbi:MAG TPA: IPT/TIG domain-containing protein [Solirubrobacteraceae bacterium]|nr:IPT/TIG domain-containing protein [Solirubrobacteraceae bacterium]